MGNVYNSLHTVIRISRTWLAGPSLRGIMPSIKSVTLDHVVKNSTGHGPVTAEVGLVLMDLSLNIVGYDRAAGAILSYPSQPGASLTQEILDVLSSCTPADLPSVKMHLRRGKDEYICRAHLVESFGGSMKPLIALHLEKDVSASDAVQELGAKYNLTEREQEALTGILMGFSSKEVAERMNISPNTVKAFLRLIMIKMGVNRRAGIVAKILENRTNTEERDTRPAVAYQRAVGPSIASNARKSRNLVERIRPRPGASGPRPC